MKNRLSILVFLAPAIFATCNKADDSAGIDDARTPLQVSSSISTRAYDNRWEANDAIGIYAFRHGTTEIVDPIYANVEYLTDTKGTQGRFTPSERVIYLPANDESYDFVAYYPFSATIGEEGYTVDVSDQSSQKEIDLMAASVQSARESAPQVNFSFIHKLSKVNVTLTPGSGMTADDLQGLRVEFTEQPAQGRFDVTRPGSAVEPVSGTKTAIALSVNGAGTFAEGIVLPSKNYDGMEMHIRLKDGKSLFTWPLNKAEHATRFEEGRKYVYTVRINRTDLTVTGQIDDWLPGNGADGESGTAY